MSKNLVIVESPAKAKTIEKYLGKDFKVLASYGHVRDLPSKEGSVDPDNHFAMKYALIEKNAKHVQAIVNAAKKAEALYLATDLDREGEAISWHLLEILNAKKMLKDKPVHRVIFHEITKKAINDAVANPRELSMPMVNAQQARRALDYLVGFKLSPLLWRKIRRGLSAGRVQSPALRMIVERENDIEAFKPQEYWTLEAKTAKGETPFNARLTHFEGNKLTQFSIEDETNADATRQVLLEAADGTLLVDKIEKKQRKRNPSPPFTTSTLQQEAARKLRFSTQKTMRTAQQLYEGIDIGEGAVGLITYMRTDSVNLADEALEEIRELISERYGQEMIPAKPRTFKTKAKNAQEAHEAIRITSAFRTPESIKSGLSAEQFKLYELIWKRTVACQMTHATINTVAIDLLCGDKGMFRANGSIIHKPGFMSVYLEGTDDQQDQQEERLLPNMEKGDELPLSALKHEQHFTEPPPRYSEASLVKSLEEHGIGRPSTYASIISVLVNREYVILEKRRFFPTDVGRVVAKFLINYFGKYVDYKFTANLEDDLDAISRGEKEWIPLMEDFWKPFFSLVKETEKVKRSDVTQEPIDEDCPKCGKTLAIRLGRNGRFIGCTAYPECDYTRNMDGQESQEPEVVSDRKCPECDADLLVRQGRYGKFIGCSTYPKCKFIESLEKPENTEITCPQCNDGTLMKRKSRKGKIFFSCSTYPKCSYATWHQPIEETCPECEWPILTLKTTKRAGSQKACPQKECQYAIPYEDPNKTTEAAD